MWLGIALAGAALALFGWWLERRDRILSENTTDRLIAKNTQLNQENDQFHAALILNKITVPSPAIFGPRHPPEDPHHRFLYRDNGKDMWLGERQIDGLGWMLCVFATTPSHGCRFNTIRNIEGLRNSTCHYSVSLVEAYDYAKENNLLPRYNKPYEDDADAIPFFLGQFHDVDLWYVKGENVAERIVHCHPLCAHQPDLQLNKVYRLIEGWESLAFQWSGPSAVAIQTGYDLAAERGLVPKINHG